MLVPSLTILLLHPIFCCILIVIDSVFFLGVYSTLRVLRIPVNWVVWIIGYLIIIASVILCYSISTPTYARYVGFGNILGIVSFLITVYSASQWASRHWYVYIKKRISSSFVQQSRNFFLFVRKHHTFFGWIVAIAAVAHMAVYLPTLSETRSYEILSGFIAIGILTLSVLLGIWIWLFTNIRKQSPPKLVHKVHSILAVAFLFSLAAHI